MFIQHTPNTCISTVQWTHLTITVNTFIQTHATQIAISLLCSTCELFIQHILSQYIRHTWTIQQYIQHILPNTLSPHTYTIPALCPIHRIHSKHMQCTHFKQSLNTSIKTHSILTTIAALCSTHEIFIQNTISTHMSTVHSTGPSKDTQHTAILSLCSPHSKRT